MTKDEFLVTRPTLAARLMNEGIDAQIAKNPFAPDRAAWIFPLNDASAEVARQYYADIGKPLPQRVEAFLASRREEVAE